MCRSINKKKAILNAKADTSASTQRLLLLEKDLEDLRARVRATEQHIQEEKDLIASKNGRLESRPPSSASFRRLASLIDKL
jgi:predicted  nucleic acid-binding Zn-ribbon protein